MIRHLIILNPTSGRGAAGRLIPEIDRLLSQHPKEISFEIIQTERSWHAAELARKAACDGYADARMKWLSPEFRRDLYAGFSDPQGKQPIS